MGCRSRTWALTARCEPYPAPMSSRTSAYPYVQERSAEVTIGSPRDKLGYARRRACSIPHWRRVPSRCRRTRPGADLRPFAGAWRRRELSRPHVVLHRHPGGERARARAIVPRRPQGSLLPALLLADQPLGGVLPHAERARWRASGRALPYYRRPNRGTWPAGEPAGSMSIRSRTRAAGAAAASRCRPVPFAALAARAVRRLWVRASGLSGARFARSGAGGVAYRAVNDALGPRVLSLPFSDACDPLLASPQARPVLLAALQAQGLPLHLRCLDQPAPATDPSSASPSGRAGTCWRSIPALMRCRAGFESGARRAIRKAERAGLAARPITGSVAAEDFRRLHVALRKRKYGLLAQLARLLRGDRAPLRRGRRRLPARRRCGRLAGGGDRVTALGRYPRPSSMRLGASMPWRSGRKISRSGPASGSA